MTNKKKCALCKTTKSVKYKHNNLDYCNRCTFKVEWRKEIPHNFLNLL